MFTRNTNATTNKRLADFTKEELIGLAKQYAKQDFTATKALLAELSVEKTDKEIIQGLFNLKYGMLLSKAQRTAGTDLLDQIEVD